MFVWRKAPLGAVVASKLVQRRTYVGWFPGLGVVMFSILHRGSCSPFLDWRGRRRTHSVSALLLVSAAEMLEIVKKKYDLDEMIVVMINSWIRGIQETKRTSRTYYELFGQ